MALKTIEAVINSDTELYKAASGTMIVAANVSNVGSGVTLTFKKQEYSTVLSQVSKAFKKDGKLSLGFALPIGQKLVVSPSSASTGVQCSLVLFDGLAIEETPVPLITPSITYDYCTSACPVGSGRVLELDPDNWGSKYTFNVAVATDIVDSAAVGDIIQVYRWSTTPNSSMVGREWVTEIPMAATGSFTFRSPTSGFYGLSFFARNSNTGYYDALCLSWDAATKTIMLNSF